MKEGRGFENTGGGGGEARGVEGKGEWLRGWGRG